MCAPLGLPDVFLSLVYEFRGFEVLVVFVNTTLSLSTSVQSVNK